MPPKFAPRKLLVAAVGVATLNYLAATACTPSPPTSGNLPAPTAEPDTGPPPPREPPPTSGNLMAPPIDTAPMPAAVDASTPTSASGAPSAAAVPSGSNRNVKPPFKPPRPPTAGNLMAPRNSDSK